MKTVSIQIGNSDDKLSQNEWHKFVKKMKDIISEYAISVHFFGCSEGCRPWQNAAWVVDVEEPFILELKQEIAAEREYYKQDSVAVGVFDTEFV
jgi:hypothetical protein